MIVEITGADYGEILPVNPYTEDDLNHSDSESRATKEQNDENCRPKLFKAPSHEGFDIIYIGYPIWWGQAPKNIYTYLEDYN